MAHLHAAGDGGETPQARCDLGARKPQQVPHRRRGQSVLHHEAAMGVEVDPHGFGRQHQLEIESRRGLLNPGGPHGGIRRQAEEQRLPARALRKRPQAGIIRVQHRTPAGRQAGEQRGLLREDPF